MEVFTLFVIAGVIIFLGFIGEIVFKKTNIPDVIWLILFGIALKAILGQYDPAAIDQIAPFFTTFALIFILFEGALNLRLNQLFKGMYGGASLAIINFLVTIVVVTVVAWISGLGLVGGLILGAILGGTSSAVVVPIVKRLKISKETSTSLTLESAISDVLCIVTTIAIVEVVKAGGLQVSGFVGGLLYTFIVAIVIGLVAGVIWLALLKKLAQYTKSYMITIAFMLLLFGLAEFLNTNGAIACLAFGIILGNSSKVLSMFNKEEGSSENTIKNSERFFYAEISFIVKAFFFVYLGLLINFSNLLMMALSLLIVLILFVARTVSALPLRKSTSPKDLAVIEGLVPKGLAAAVLAQLPVQAGIEGAQVFGDLVLGVVFFSILLSTILIFLVEKNKYQGTSVLIQKFIDIFKKDALKIQQK